MVNMEKDTPEVTSDEYGFNVRLAIKKSTVRKTCRFLLMAVFAGFLGINAYVLKTVYDNNDGMRVSRSISQVQSELRSHERTLMIGSTRHEKRQRL